MTNDPKHETADAAGGRSFVSAHDVARHAGVSRSAVSRVFTPGASASPETRRRVLAAAAELGYHVNHLARGLMRRETGIVCLLVSEIESPQNARLVRHLTGRLQAAGKVAMVLALEGSGDDAGGALRQTLNYRADATVVMSGTPSEALVQTCIDNGQRLVLINREHRLHGPDAIGLDNGGAARAAALMLVRGGCRRLAFANTNSGTPSSLARENGFRDAVGSLGLDVFVERTGAGTSYENGLALGRRLFVRADRPDGVFCVNDLIACGVMDAARREFGMRVPEDVSIVGFDDIAQASWLSYRLTTFAQPADQIAARVVDLVARRNGEAAVTMELAAETIWRTSVRSSPRQND